MSETLSETGGAPLVVWGVGTTRTFRVHWLLAELGLPYETRRIESRTGETQADGYRHLNPKEKIPTLQHGDFALTESLAIMRYLRSLSDVLPYDAWQTSAQGRARCDEWASFILMELDATSLYVVRRHRDLPAIYGEAPHAVDSSIAYYEKMLNACADRIPTSGPVWGSLFSEIDILLAGSIEWGRHVGAEVPQDALDWAATITDRPAYRSARSFNYKNLQLSAPPRPPS